MATYKDPFASPDPPSIAHEANRIFMKLIDDGNEVYHMYEQFYFFKTKEGPVPFDKIRSMYWILFNLGYLPYWRIGVQHSVCKLVLQKCKAVAKPWTPLPADSRLITPLGTTPTRLEYAAYMMDVVQFGMHKPDGVNGMIRQLKITLPPRRGRIA